MAHVVVVGAGLGGLPTAYELRHFLDRGDRVTLVSDHPQFTFIPGLIQVALGLKKLKHIQLDLARLARRHGLHLELGRVTGLDPHTQQLTLDDDRSLHYDYLAIAVGASLDFDRLPGSGPHGGYTHSVCTADHALAASVAWEQWIDGLADRSGSIVVGSAPGVGCFGPAYEFMLMADWVLRRRGLRDRVSITYLSPEPYIGHLGVEGIHQAQEITEDLLTEKGITAIARAEIVRVEPEAVILNDGRQFPFTYAMIIPAFRGVRFVRDTPGLADEEGFIPVLPTQRHPHYANIYALGVCVALDSPPVEALDIPIGLPKSGEMSEAMGAAVAHNIAVAMGALAKQSVTPTLEALCFAEFGETGVAYIAAPVILNPDQMERRTAFATRGIWVNWAKMAFEYYFLWKMRLGWGLPWFESWGLWLLIGLSLLRPIQAKR